METTKTRRNYRRRSDEERIAELEARIVELKARQAAKEAKEDPVLKEIPKVQKRLLKFADVAAEYQRPDIVNSVLAFNAGLERILHSESRRAAAAAAAAAAQQTEDPDTDFE